MAIVNAQAPAQAVSQPLAHGWDANGTAVGTAGVIGALAMSAPRARLVVYKEWVSGGWQLCTSNCVPMRGSFIADPAPRGIALAIVRNVLLVCG